MKYLLELFSQEKPLSLPGLLLGAYIVCSVLFISYALYSDLTGRVYVRGYNEGSSQTSVNLVSQIFTEAEKCQPFPVTISGQEITLQKVGCPQ